MAENPQHSTEQPLKSPFSPMQTGCAFVMLTNMLIYLAVVAFTLNLLDASKIDASYLAQRGFTVRTKEERAEDRLVRKRQTEPPRLQQNPALSPITVVRREPSPAEKLSALPSRDLASSLPDEPERPQAALVPGSLQTGGTGARPASSLRHGSRVFSLGGLWQSYSPLGLQVGGIIAPERYDTLPVELASGFDIPKFTLPSINPAAAYLYRPSDPIPQGVRGSPRFSTPAVGAEKKKPAPELPPGESEQPAKDMP